MASSSKKVGIKGKVIESQGREIIANVLKFMKEEAENGKPIIDIIKYKARLIRATGISKSTLRHIMKEAEDVSSGKVASFSTPHKERPRRSPKSTLREDEIEMIRLIIRNFYVVENRQPTLKDIHYKMRECGLTFKGGLTTLSKVLHKIGFKWLKTNDKKKILVETCDIRVKREGDMNLSNY